MVNADMKWMRIGELAKKLGEPQHVIRWWEESFGLLVIRSAKGQRVYTPRNVADLVFIQKLLREVGLTHRGVRAQLRKARKAEPVLDEQPYLRAHRA